MTVLKALKLGPAALAVALTLPVLTNGCSDNPAEALCCKDFKVGAELTGADFGVDASIKGQFEVFAQAVLAAAAARSGRRDIAQSAARRIRELYPDFESDALANFERWHFDAAFYDALVGGLRAAGLELGTQRAGASRR